MRSACNLASNVLGTLPVVAVTSQSSISTDVFQEIGIEVVLSVSRRGGVCDRIAREFVGNSFLAALSVHSSDELSGARRRKNPKVEAANSAIYSLPLEANDRQCGSWNERLASQE
jgi:hypothetical protein